MEGRQTSELRRKGKVFLNLKAVILSKVAQTCSFWNNNCKNAYSKPQNKKSYRDTNFSFEPLDIVDFGVVFPDEGWEDYSASHS